MNRPVARFALVLVACAPAGCSDSFIIRNTATYELQITDAAAHQPLAAASVTLRWPSGHQRQLVTDRRGIVRWTTAWENNLYQLRWPTFEPGGPRDRDILRFDAVLRKHGFRERILKLGVDSFLQDGHDYRRVESVTLDRDP